MTSTRSSLAKVTPSSESPLFKPVAMVIFAVVAAVTVLAACEAAPTPSTYVLVAASVVAVGVPNPVNLLPLKGIFPEIVV